MNKGTIAGIVVGLLIFVGLGWFFLSQDPAPLATTIPVEDAKSLSDLEVKNSQGETVSLSDYAGQPLVINSWATWCPFCLDELPDFAELQEQFGDKVTIIAINRSESQDAAEGYLKDLDVMDKILYLYDQPDEFYRSLGGFAMPQTIFVDSAGLIRDNKKGVMTKDEIQTRIQALLDADK